MTLPLADMRAALRGAEADLPEAPAHWGAVWAHSLHGMAYHFHVLVRNRGYPNFAPHRSLGVGRELLLNARRLALRPFLALAARRRLRRLRRSGAVFHLVLLQLAHDSSMLHHSRFRSVAEFARHCLEGFAAGAPRHHRLVFKTHPFDDGREAIEAPVRAEARRLGIADRVTLIHGGKLGALLDRARSVVTVNSTGGQQALWRGLPVSLHGEAVYDKPEFVSRQPLAEFFAAPPRPDLAAYRDFRRFLIHTSQVRGGFYTAEGRASALRSVVDLMLADADPYERLLTSIGAGAQRDRLRLAAGE
jgi:capsular polysaccharide export protein